eukprot:13648523-Ditylum_brightwellii.AAC.1
MAHFFIEQAYLSIKYLLGHLRESSLTGQHFMVLLSQVQLVSGNARPYLSEVKSNKEYVLHSWLGGIQRYLCYTNATIDVHKAWVSSLQRVNGVMLMGMFETDKPGRATLNHLNQVRQYLGATTPADLCNDNGQFILCGVLTGDLQLCPTTLWPNQEKPSQL